MPSQGSSPFAFATNLSQTMDVGTWIVFILRARRVPMSYSEARIPLAQILGDDIP